MLLFVVYEEDRGMGVSIIGVYDSIVRADEVAAPSRRYHVQEVILNE